MSINYREMSEGLDISLSFYISKSGGLATQVKLEREKTALLLLALMDIAETGGKACDNHRECGHVGCGSSRNSYIIAMEALKTLKTYSMMWKTLRMNLQ